MITVYPTVTSIEPRTSGDLGGNTITINGHGFSTVCGNNDVKLDGVSCSIVTCTNTQITCIAGPKANVTGDRRVGTRGAYTRVWFNFNGNFNTPRYPNFPNYTMTQTEALQGFGVNIADQYTQIVDALFVPPVTANYTFHVIGDDWNEFQLSTTSSPENLSVAAMSPNYSPYFWSFPNQTSTPRLLQAGTPYFVRVRQAEGNGGDFVRVAMLIDRPTTPLEEKFNSRFERQRLTIRAAIVRESVTLVFSGDINGTFYVGGPLQYDLTRPIRMHVDSDKSILAAAVATVVQPSCGSVSVTRKSNATLATVTYNITINCPVAGTFSTLAITTQSDYTGSTPQVTRQWPASTPVRGSYRFGYRGNFTAPLAYNANDGTVQSALTTAFGFKNIIVSGQNNENEGRGWEILFRDPTVSFVCVCVCVRMFVCVCVCVCACVLFVCLFFPHLFLLYLFDFDFDFGSLPPLFYTKHFFSPSPHPTPRATSPRCPWTFRA